MKVKMEFEVPPIEWRTAPGLCSCCLSERRCGDIRTEYHWMGKKETYADTLKECFHIEISFQEAGDSNERSICEACVARLRDATSFKQQVVRSLQLFTDHLRNGASLSTMSVKETSSTFPAVKLEAGVMLSEDTKKSPLGADTLDSDYDESDLMPLKHKAVKEELVELSFEDKTPILSAVKTTSVYISAQAENKSRCNKPKLKVERTVQPVKGSGSRVNERNMPRLKRTYHPTKTAAKKVVPVIVAERSACHNAAAIEEEPIDSCNGGAYEQACVHGNKNPSCMGHHGRAPEDNLAKVTIKIEPADSDEERRTSGDDSNAATVKQELDKELAVLQPSDMRCMSRPCKREPAGATILCNFQGIPHRRSDDSERNDVSSERSLEKTPGNKRAVAKTAHACDQCGHVRQLNRPSASPQSCSVCATTYSKIHTKNRGGKRFYDCNDCGKRFWHKSMLTRHVRIHTGEQPYSCDVCNKCFTQQYNWLRHLKIHTGERPFSCDICSKRFKQKVHLIEHIKIHTNDSPHSCSFCSKSFTQPYFLLRHMRIHTGDRPYGCDVCDKGFTQRYHLAQHKKIHTDERPFQCEVCCKSFVHQYVLTRHMNIHTSERPFRCDICSKCFRRKGNLKDHKKIHAG